MNSTNILEKVVWFILAIFSLWVIQNGLTNASPTEILFGLSLLMLFAGMVTGKFTVDGFGRKK